MKLITTYFSTMPQKMPLGILLSLPYSSTGSIAGADSLCLSSKFHVLALRPSLTHATLCRLLQKTISGTFQMWDHDEHNHYLKYDTDCFDM
jgi:hypothetical protein